MKIGIKLPNSGPFANAAFMARAAIAAENLGFDSVWVHDHVSRSPEAAEHHFVGGAWEAWDRPVIPNVFESLTTLGFIGGLTKRVELGTSVVVLPLRNPVWLAKMTATIDNLTNGRFILGVGVGGSMYLTNELRAMGANHLYRDRGRVVDEWIDVMRGVWDEVKYTYRGQFIDIVDAEVYPKPASGRVPIWIGGTSAPGRRRAATRGDGWIPMFLKPDQVKSGMDQVREAAAACNRNPEDILLGSEHWLAIDETTEQAIERSAATRTGMAHYTASVPGVSVHDRDVAAGEGNLLGDCDDVRETISEYEAAGVDHLVLRVIAHSENDYIDTLQALSETVGRKIPDPNLTT